MLRMIQTISEKKGFEQRMLEFLFYNCLVFIFFCIYGHIHKRKLCEFHVIKYLKI